MRPSTAGLAHVFSSLLASTSRPQSDQTFLNQIYPEKSDKAGTLPFSANAQTHVQVRLPAFWAEHAANVTVIHFTEKKGWQCAEAHSPPRSLPGPPRDCTTSLRPSTTQPMPRMDVDCYCEHAYLWWSAFRRAERRVQPSTRPRDLAVALGQSQ